MITFLPFYLLEKGEIMNLKKIAFGSILTLSMLLAPQVAQADQGVLLDNATLKNQDGIVEAFQKGTKFSIVEETPTHFTLKTPEGTQSVKAQHFIKTIIETPKAYKAKADTMMYLEPSILSIELQAIVADEVLQFTDTDSTGEWVKVRSAFGMEGWVLLKDLDMQYDTSVHATKMYMQDDVTIKGKAFKFREEVNVVDFVNNAFVVRTNNGDYSVPAKYVDFNKPAPRPVVARAVSASQGGGVKETRMANVEGATAQALINAGYTQLGKPYGFGANGPNAWDCSSFTQYAFRQIGISIPRTASGQAGIGVHVDKGSLRAGDLVFFQTYKAGPSHVGIYLGGGKMLHAGSSNGVEVTNLNYDYWQSRYLFAKRVF